MLVLPVPRGPEKQVGVGDAIVAQRVAHRLRHVLLADDLLEGLASPLLVQALGALGDSHVKCVGRTCHRPPATVVVV